jgi:hypothetical protein
MRYFRRRERGVTVGSEMPRRKAKTRETVKPAEGCKMSAKKAAFLIKDGSF